MIDLSKIPDEAKIARGEYSIVRSEHENIKKEIANIGQEMMTKISHLNKAMQGESIYNGQEYVNQLFLEFMDLYTRFTENITTGIKLCELKEHLKIKAFK